MRWIEGKRLTKEKVAPSLKREGNSWGRMVTTKLPLPRRVRRGADEVSSFPAGLRTASNKIKNKINSAAGQGRAQPHSERKKHQNEVCWGHNPS